MNMYQPKPPVNSNSYLDNHNSANDDILPMIQTDTTNDQDSHFFAYFASLCITVALGYFIYHNKNRVRIYCEKKVYCYNKKFKCLFYILS